MPVVRVPFCYKSASAELVYITENRYRIANLRADKPQLGHGGMLMLEICKWADLHQATLTLLAKGYGRTNLMPNKSLQTWYESFGFIRYITDNRTEIYMVRDPRTNNTGNSETPTT